LFEIERFLTDETYREWGRKGFFKRGGGSFATNDGETSRYGKREVEGLKAKVQGTASSMVA